MKVYIVRSVYDIEGVYATEKAAKEAAKQATWCAEMGGSHAIYGVQEEEVKEA